jgi:hypothetical protein
MPVVVIQLHSNAAASQALYKPDVPALVPLSCRCVCLQELDDERAALRHQQKELRRQHHQLQADREAKQGHLAELSAKCRDVQMLKFGQVIDVALLDTIGIRNRAADELREALKQQVSGAIIIRLQDGTG